MLLPMAKGSPAQAQPTVRWAKICLLALLHDLVRCACLLPQRLPGDWPDKLQQLPTSEHQMQGRAAGLLQGSQHQPASHY